MYKARQKTFLSVKKKNSVYDILWILSGNNVLNAESDAGGALSSAALALQSLGQS